MMGDVFMVFEYFDFDLAALVKKYHAQMTDAQRKAYMFQLLKALDFMHRKRHLHRDVKPANLLVNRSNRLVLADFGLVKHKPEGCDRRLTSKACTLHYRAPEVLLGFKQYGGRSDVWAAGLIFAEMFSGRAALPANVEMDQLKAMIRLLGSPTGEDLQFLRKYSYFNVFEAYLEHDAEFFSRSVGKRYGRLMSDSGLDLLEKLLTWTPNSRLKASEALRHPYFSDVAVPDSLPPWQIESAHDFAGASQNRQRPDQRRERSASRSVSRSRSMLDGSRTGGSKRSRDDVSISRSPTRGFTTMERAAASSRPQQNRSRSSSQLRGMTIGRSRGRARPAVAGRSHPPSTARPAQQPPRGPQDTAPSSRAPSQSRSGSQGPPQPRSGSQSRSGGPPQPRSGGPPQPRSGAPQPRSGSQGPPQPRSGGPPQPRSTSGMPAQ